MVPGMAVSTLDLMLLMALPQRLCSRSLHVLEANIIVAILVAHCEATSVVQDLGTRAFVENVAEQELQ